MILPFIQSLSLMIMPLFFTIAYLYLCLGPDSSDVLLRIMLIWASVLVGATLMQRLRFDGSSVLRKVYTAFLHSEKTIV